jgi:5-methyltetrahydropteroyltriglutamate--homocysteine methyltransferase
VPDVDWLVEKIQGFVDSGVLKGRPQHIWVNPDCGLKTRRWAEVIPSLRNMVEAAAIMRARLAGTTAATAAAGHTAKSAAKATAGAGAGVNPECVGPKSAGCAANGCCH